MEALLQGAHRFLVVFPEPSQAMGEGSDDVGRGQTRRNAYALAAHHMDTGECACGRKASKPGVSGGEPAMAIAYWAWRRWATPASLPTQSLLLGCFEEPSVGLSARALCILCLLFKARSALLSP